jgi:RNA polymerase sigma-70 factor (ECF subfamily)
VTDADLVARARQGDTAAFGELVDRHRSAVCRAARAALPCHADAEDAAQDAFLVAYRRLDSFRGDSSFKTWLLTIAWRQAINRRRSLSGWWSRLVDTSKDDDFVSRQPTSGPSPEQTVTTREIHRAIAGEIRRLTPKLRDALLLAQSGEHTYDEMAAMLRVPLGTVKWRISEARRVVKQKLRDRGLADVG